jgi:hypothetical protein
MPRAKKPMRFKTEADAVAHDVKRQFKDKLPLEWADLVEAACYPGLLEEPSLLGCPGHANLRKCFARQPDLAAEIYSYARQRCAEYDAGRQGRSSRSKVRAVLLRSWRARLVEHNGEWSSPTLDEARQLRTSNGKPCRLKTAELRELKDPAIRDWLRREYGINMSQHSFREARRSLA